MNGYNPPSKAAERTLRQIRRDAGLSLRELEKASGVNRAILSQLENGLLAPSRGHLGQLEAVLGVPLEWKPMVVEAMP